MKITVTQVTEIEVADEMVQTALLALIIYQKGYGGLLPNSVIEPFADEYNNQITVEVNV